MREDWLCRVLEPHTTGCEDMASLREHGVSACWGTQAVPADQRPTTEASQLRKATTAGDCGRSARHTK